MFMSGHSHAKTIKHDKEIADQKRGNIFSKFARQISLAVRDKGSNPETNSSLRFAIERAKSFNMPKENIERAIKKGTGELAGENLEKILFEAYGPGDIAIIVEGITDNKNRALGEIKNIINDYNGKLVGEGSVKWMFERRGLITITLNNETQNPKTKEELEMKTIEAGADDIYWQDDLLEIYTKPEDLEKVKKNLEAQNIKIESALLGWLAKEEIAVDAKDKERAEKLFNALDDNEAVQEIYSNLKN